ncbi:MAG: translation initiation factor [Pseudomonadales bacterium]
MAVYSTDHGRLCPRCNQPVAKCMGHPKSQQTAPSDIVRVHREIKGRGGKPVSIIRGLALDHSELKRLCKQLKKHCGVGGTVSDTELIIQGDQRHKILAFLEQEGITAKLGGG